LTSFLNWLVRLKVLTGPDPRRVPFCCQTVSHYASRTKRVETEQRQLIQWAKENRRLGGRLPPEFGRGGEHQVYFHRSKQRYLKATLLQRQLGCPGKNAARVEDGGWKMVRVLMREEALAEPVSRLGSSGGESATRRVGRPALRRKSSGFQPVQIQKVRE
jgi:hypothetical protein